MKSSKILVVIANWPSILSPYLTYLYPRIVEKHPNIEFYQFEKGTDTNAHFKFNDKLLSSVLIRSFYRTQVSSPITIGLIIFKILFFTPIRTIQIFIRMQRLGLSVKKIIKQLVQHNRLIGKDYSLIHINAVQTMKHLSIKAFFPKSRVIVSIRGQDFDFKPTEFDKYLKFADHFHVLSKYQIEQLLSRGIDRSKVSKIPPAALNIEALITNDTKNRNSQEYKVCTAARLFWTKGHIYAIRAVATLIRNNPNIAIEYNIIGTGSEEELLVNAVRLMGLSKFINFLGWKTQEEVNQIYLNSNVCLLLSIEEGFNNSILQAQSLGLPCIVSDAGGLPENVLHDQTGFVVPKYDSEEPYKALQFLLDSEVTEQKFRKNGSIRARDNFSIKEQEIKYLKMYQKFI